MKRVVVLALLLCAVAPSAHRKDGSRTSSSSPGHFGDAMDLMRASLGVGCDYCHVAKGNDIDYASDDKPEKKRAR